MNTGDGGREGGMHMVMIVMISRFSVRHFAQDNSIIVSFTHIFSLGLARQRTQIHLLEAKAPFGESSARPLVRSFPMRSSNSMV